jgi:hypothetical protein
MQTDHGHSNLEGARLPGSTTERGKGCFEKSGVVQHRKEIIYCT